MKLYYSTSLVTFIYIHIVIIIPPISSSSSHEADTETDTGTTDWLASPNSTPPPTSPSSSLSFSSSNSQQTPTPNSFDHASVDSQQLSEENEKIFKDLLRSELLKVIGLKKVPEKQKRQNKAYVPRAMLEEYQQTRDSVRDFIPEDRDFYGKIDIHELDQNHESVLDRFKRQEEIEVDMGPDNEATRRLHVKRNAKDLTYLTTQSEPEDVLPALEHMLPPISRSSNKQKQFISVHLKFNMSQGYFINPMEVDELESAELNLFREHVLSKARYQRIYIIQIIDFDKHNDPITRIHDSRRIDTGDTSPLKFDVYDIIKYWLLNPTKNYGIIVRVTNDEDRIYKQDQFTNASSKNNDDDNNDDNENYAANTNQTEAEHVRLKRQFQSTSESDEIWAKKQPSLILAKSVNQDNSSSRTRVTRASSSSTTATTTTTTTGLSGPNQKSRGKTKTPRQVDKCSMRSLSINFDDMGWSSWIIAPTSYYANYCAGDCSFPLMDQQNATNHAIIQSIFHSVGRLTPKSCCAPTKLGKMAILYQLDGTVQMRHYDDMIVESCGCA